MTAALQTLIRSLEQSLIAGTFVRLVLSGARPDLNPPPPDRATARCIDLRGDAVLSVTFQDPRRSVTQNFNRDEFRSWLRDALPRSYRNALLCTTRQDLQWIQGLAGKDRLVKHAASQEAPPPRTHDHGKASLLDASAESWLKGLGVLDDQGRLRASMADKHRQIHRYLEILSHHLTAVVERRPGPLTVVDMGSGKGYLTFAVWHWLHRVRKTESRVIGIEAREDLVGHCRRIAASCDATGLEFLCASVDTAPLEKVDVLIALHACNTATDDALLRGVASGAEAILVAPCCHQDLRPRLGNPEPWDALLDHGMLKERFSEWLTDGLRTLHLEAAGYRTSVLEFVPPDHTPKNLLICGIRGNTPAQRLKARERILSIHGLFGLGENRLAPLLDTAGNAAPDGP